MGSQRASSLRSRSEVMRAARQQDEAPTTWPASCRTSSPRHGCHNNDRRPQQQQQPGSVEAGRLSLILPLPVSAIGSSAHAVTLPSRRSSEYTCSCRVSVHQHVLEHHHHRPASVLVLYTLILAKPREKRTFFQNVNFVSRPRVQTTSACLRLYTLL